LTELVASGLEKLGVPKAAAQGWAEVIMAVGMIAVTLGASGAATAVARGVGAAARTVARAVAELVKRLMTAVRSLFSGGGSQVASTVARTASQVAQETAQVATQAVAKSLSATRLKIQTGLKLGMGGVGVEQASTQTAGAVQSYQANQRQADVAEGRAFNAKLQQQMDEETDRVKAIMEQASASASRAIQILSNHSDTASYITRRGAATV
jgi:hypothetical protein